MLLKYISNLKLFRSKHFPHFTLIHTIIHNNQTNPVLQSSTHNTHIHSITHVTQIQSIFHNTQIQTIGPNSHIPSNTPYSQIQLIKTHTFYIIQHSQIHPITYITQIYPTIQIFSHYSNSIHY